MAKLYLLKNKYNKAISYHFKPPYEEVENNGDFYQIMVWDSAKNDTIPADVVEISKEWKPFHGKFEKYEHLYDFVGREVGNKLEALSARGQLNEPLEKQFDCSEVWDKGKMTNSNEHLDEIKKHYYCMAGIAME